MNYNGNYNVEPGPPGVMSCLRDVRNSVLVYDKKEGPHTQFAKAIDLLKQLHESSTAFGMELKDTINLVTQLTPRVIGSSQLRGAYFELAGKFADVIKEFPDKILW